VLMAGVMFILIMACGNVANLMLARGVGRTSEFALRSALGATRGRVLRQLLTESVVLAAVGGAAGLGLAPLLLRAAPSLVPAGSLPLSVALRMDWRVVTFAIVIASLAALASALGPAWQVSRTSLVEAIGMGTRMSSVRGGRVRTILAVLQVAAAVLLTTGAGLFVRTIVALNKVDAGYRADRVLTMSIGLSFQRYAPPSETPPVLSDGRGRSVASTGRAYGVDPCRRSAARRVYARPGISGDRRTADRLFSSTGGAVSARWRAIF